MTRLKHSIETLNDHYFTVCFSYNSQNVVYWSIALWELYQKSFDSDSIRLTVQSQIEREASENHFIRLIINFRPNRLIDFDSKFTIVKIKIILKVQNDEFWNIHDQRDYRRDMRSGGFDLFSSQKFFYCSDTAKLEYPVNSYANETRDVWLFPAAGQSAVTGIQMICKSSDGHLSDVSHLFRGANWIHLHRTSSLMIKKWKF